jgi:outer membrane protein assembly factor BamB
VDANWELSWEQQTEATERGRAQLLEGGLVFSSLSFEGDPDEVWSNTELKSDLRVVHFDLDGNRTSETRAEIANYRLGGGILREVFAGQYRVITTTWRGWVMVTASDSGDLVETVLDTKLALEPQDSVPLPGDRLAIASSSYDGLGTVVTVIASDGQVLWEQTYAAAQDAMARTIAYDPHRQQILFAGSYRGDDLGGTRTWMIATDLEGKQQWELTRLPPEVDIDGNFTSLSANRGPRLHDVIVGADGRLLAIGDAPELSLFVVGSEQCE